MSKQKDQTAIKQKQVLEQRHDIPPSTFKKYEELYQNEMVAASQLKDKILEKPSITHKLYKRHTYIP